MGARIRLPVERKHVRQRGGAFFNAVFLSARQPFGFSDNHRFRCLARRLSRAPGPLHIWMAIPMRGRLIVMLPVLKIVV